MNIIKFKDVVLAEDDKFNEKFKGKYAYWIHMKYAVSFDDLGDNYKTYELSSDPRALLTSNGIDYLDVEDGYVSVVDVADTEKVNNIDVYIARNNFTPDKDITIEELKKFRTWIATKLLDIGIFNDTESHVLKYYANGMYNDVVKYLSEFGESKKIVSNIIQSPCSCQNNNISGATQPLNICDPVYIYKNNIYEKMVDMFGKTEFWSQYDINFLEEFKKYIDNIIKCDFILYKTPYISDFNDCGCNNTNTQENMLKILQQLSNSLNYIINNDILGHKNYISTSFNNWAKYLYESMEW